MTATSTEWVGEFDQAPADHEPERRPPESILQRVVDEHPDLTEEAALTMAREVSAQLAAETKRRMVRRLADDTEAAKAMNLGVARAVTAAAFVAETTAPPTPCLGGLLAEGHNGILAAGYKCGKSTTVEQMAKALVTGTPFLGTFDVTRPYRVAFLNYEMTEDDFRARIRALGLDEVSGERLVALNLRGAGLSLTAAAGRRWLTGQLIAHQTEFAIIDTYSAASAPSVESENDNAGGRRWLMTWDAIKAQCGIATSLITHHTGRGMQVEGEEHGRGATVLDDWADVRLVLTRDRDSGNRFLASEGRSPYQLPESMLTFHATTRDLTLGTTSIGENRALARVVKNAQAVAEAVAKHPGILTTKLRDAIGDDGITNNAAKASAVEAAKRRGLIHTHAGTGNRVRHYTGAIHEEAEACPDPAYTPEETE